MSKAPSVLFKLKNDTVEELFYNSAVNSRNEDVLAQYAVYVNDQHVPQKIRLADVGTKYFEKKRDALLFQIKLLESRISVLLSDIDVIDNGRAIPDSADFDDSEEASQTSIDDYIEESN